MSDLSTKIKQLSTLYSDSSFVASLVKQFNTKGNLSEKQVYWVNKLLDDAGTQPQPTKPEPVTFPVDTVNAMFDRASVHLNHPRVVLGRTRYHKASTSSKFVGQIIISDANTRQYIGRVTTTGRYFGTKLDRDSNTYKEISSFMCDPVVATAAYGKLSGFCSFCRRALTDERSTSVGYGPICADHFGLPWGN